MTKLTEEQCPVCGYYCLGNGGVGCINKPALVEAELQPVQEPVSFYIYKETAPRLNLTNVVIDALPWVYDQDPSSGFSARLKVYLTPPDQTAEIERLQRAVKQNDDTAKHYLAGRTEAHQCIATLKTEIERLRNLSACEACAEIPSVMEYFKQCEERIATLGAALREAKLAIENELTPCGCFQGCEFCNGKIQPEEALATINKALGEE